MTFVGLQSWQSRHSIASDLNLTSLPQDLRHQRLRTTQTISDIDLGQTITGKRAYIVMARFPLFGRRISRERRYHSRCQARPMLFMGYDFSISTDRPDDVRARRFFPRDAIFFDCRVRIERRDDVSHRTSRLYRLWKRRTTQSDNMRHATHSLLISEPQYLHFTIFGSKDDYFAASSNLLRFPHRRNDIVPLDDLVDRHQRAFGR